MHRVARAFTYAALGAWTLVCLFPLYWVAVSSIKPPFSFIENVPRYLPFADFAPSLHAWRQIIFNPDDDTLGRFVNSLVVGAGATALTVLTGALATYALARSSGSIGRGFGRWNEGVFVAILSTRLLPPVITVLPIFYLVQYIGLADTRTALILTYTAANLPAAMWLLRGFLDEVPIEREEAAQLDGASRTRVFFTVTLPLMRRGLAATSVLVFLLCWNEYLLAVYLTAEHAMTMPPFLASQMTSREQMAAAEPDDYARLAVVIILIATPVLLFAGAFQRLMMRIGRG